MTPSSCTKHYIIMQVRKLFFLAVSLLSSLYCNSQSELDTLLFSEMNIIHSKEYLADATFSGELCYGANRYFKEILEPLDVPFQLLVLSQKDWPEYTYPNLIYGMPHYKGDGKTLVVAAEDNDFWRMQVPDPAAIASPFKELIPVVYNLNDELSGRYFFDLLAVHELSHAWHWAAKLNTQRNWLSELYCNIMLHTYIAEEKPEFLSALETLPAYWADSDASGLKYTTLKQFEDDYNVIGHENPFNYGWYQFRFHRAAKLLYDESGPEVTKKLWDFLKNHPEKLSDEKLLTLLETEVHPFLAELVINW